MFLVEDMREFAFDRAMGWKANEEILPPPNFSDIGIPFNWGWHQNPNVIEQVDPITGEKILINRTMPPVLETEYISRDVEVVPDKSLYDTPEDPVLLSLISELQKVMDQRPIWTRRALTNLMMDNPGYYLIKSAFQHVGYQFRSGPFRDAIIRFGIDPRRDPQYRIYQTMFFKIHTEEEALPGMPWHDARHQYAKRADGLEGQHSSHIFDGKTILRDGRVWQFCDVTDPLLVDLIADAPVQAKISGGNEGWFYNGSWAKIRAIMKTKLIAIQAGKTVMDEDFKMALEVPDEVDTSKGRSVHIPVPDLRLTEQEIGDLKMNGLFNANAIGSGGMRKRYQKEKARSERIRKRVGKPRRQREEYRPRKMAMPNKGGHPRHPRISQKHGLRDLRTGKLLPIPEVPASSGAGAGMPDFLSAEYINSVLDPSLMVPEPISGVTGRDSGIGGVQDELQGLDDDEEEEEEDEDEEEDDDDEDDDEDEDEDSDSDDGSLIGKADSEDESDGSDIMKHLRTKLG